MGDAADQHLSPFDVGPAVAAGRVDYPVIRLAAFRAFRNHLLLTMFEALSRTLQRPGLSLVDAAVTAREQRRMVGRALPTHAVGSTLLLKGLEAEHAILLDADEMNSRHF